MDPKLAAMREDYQKGGLVEADLADDPIIQFQRWFEDAIKGWRLRAERHDACNCR